MYCERCGTANDAGQAWCTGCGSQLTAAAPPLTPQMPQPATTLKPISAYCISCGHGIDPDTRFCTACGADQDSLNAEPAGAKAFPVTMLSPAATSTSPAPAPCGQFCVACGQALEPGTRFCIACGADQNQQGKPVFEAPIQSAPAAPPMPASVSAPIAQSWTPPPTPSAVYCISCGQALEPDIRFCIACGADQNQQGKPVFEAPIQSAPAAPPMPASVSAPIAQSWTPPPTPSAVYCISCGQALEPDIRFCIACGADQAQQGLPVFDAPIRSAPPIEPQPPAQPDVPAPVVQGIASIPSTSCLFCVSCGKTLDPGTRFCIQCGADQIQCAAAAPQTAAEISSGETGPSPVTSAPMESAPAFCVSCGARLEPGTRFCTGCGTDQHEPQVSAPLPSLGIMAGTATEVGSQASYSPPPATLQGTGTRASGPWLMIVICVVLVGALGAGGFLAYRNMDAIKQLFARWMPGKTDSAAETQTAAGLQPDSVTQTQPPATGQEAVPTQITPPTTADTGYPPVQNQPPATQVATAAPPQSDRTGFNAQIRVPANLPTTEIAVAPPTATATTTRVQPPVSEKPVVAVDEPVKPKVETQIVRDVPPPKQDVVTTPPPDPVPPPVGRKPPAPPVEPRGVIQWTGEAAKDQTLIIDRGNASFGNATGKLPGIPCLVTIQPSDVSIAQAPGPSNGFERIVLRFPKKGRFTVTIQWEILR